VDVQLGASCLEVNIAERLQPADFQFGEFYKQAAISRESLEVIVALQIQIGTHLLDLKIGHITYPAAQGAFMTARAAELKTLNQTPMREHLAGRAYNFTQTRIIGKNAGNVSASGNPDNRLVFLGPQVPAGVNLEKLRMQWSLEKAERQFFNSYIDLRRFHHEYPNTKITLPILSLLYKNRRIYSSPISVLVCPITPLIGRLFRKLRNSKD
jgi:hypothetical protein